ncbi:head-tail connector protein [Sphingomonas sp. ID0503]|uniref:head-tail connector protein n=1 Tax=Sphingomonas sp. ID0503 TaxID=3399691 RepID=UPI003AFA7AD4
MIEDAGFASALGGALAEAEALMRVEHGAEDALIGSLIATAVTLCEGFTGTVILSRTFRETVPASAEWRRLSRTPVAVIDGIDGVPVDGYAIDIDANGDGWVRVSAPGQSLVTVDYVAGGSASWAEVPVAVRQGVLRLAAHLYAHRDGEAEPPTAVAALWRPFRRMRVG